MARNSFSSAILSFGVFEADLHAGELLKRGKRIKLQDQPFQVLSVLLRRPGEVVTREELRKQIWPEDTFVDFDNSLNTAINKLREALGDSADCPRFVETLPRRGYRFLAPVTCDQRETMALAASRWKISMGVAAAPVCLTIGLITFLTFSPARVPEVVGITQVTHSGRVDPWRRMVSDGSRVYFLERAGDHWNLMQTSVKGGEPHIVAAPFQNTLILDISPDHTELLIASFTTRGGLMPLWIWPVQGGAPRRVGEVLAYDAVWFPQRMQILYSTNDGVYSVERDGANSRLIAATKGRPSMFAWSPNGRSLRFTLDNGDFKSSAIWEMDVDGKHLRLLFPSWGDPSREESGAWGADGRYYFFEAFRGGSMDLWENQEKGIPLHRRQPGPVRLTAGPQEFSHAMVADQRLFAIGATPKAEIIRFNPKSHVSGPLFQAWSATYSRDGQWLVYVSPEGNLRKIRAGGGEELLLTDLPLKTDSPAWSPDGKQISFRGRKRDNQSWKLYVTSAAGGNPREIAPSGASQGPSTWSPDGKFLAFAREESDASELFAQLSIQVLNFETNQVTRLSESQGKNYPSWSPDGRFIAALSSDQRKMLLFDLHAQNWSQVAVGNFIGGGLSWSADSQFLYFQDLLAPNQPVNRVRMHDRKIDKVATFEVYLQGGVPRCGFQGLTPDGALLVTLLRNHADIYAFSIDFP